MNTDADIPQDEGPRWEPRSWRAWLVDWVFVARWEDWDIRRYRDGALLCIPPMTEPGHDDMHTWHVCWPPDWDHNGLYIPLPPELKVHCEALQKILR